MHISNLYINWLFRVASRHIGPDEKEKAPQNEVLPSNLKHNIQVWEKEKKSIQWFNEGLF